MSESEIEKHQQEAIKDIADRTGVNASDVAKIVDHLGLKGALKNRLAVDGNLSGGLGGLRIAAGQQLK